MRKSLDKEIYNVKAPAKINIGLRILSKRKDGYHNLETIFYPVKIYDDIKLEIEKLPATAKKNIMKVASKPEGNIPNKKNICYRAVELFFKEFRINAKYRLTINIKKNIPIGAGLGGGSSDAASVLLILLEYFRLKAKPNEILTFAQDIGSDVPFFLIGKPAYAEGKGEKLTPLPKFRVKGKILLVNPGIHISTPWAFKELRVKSRKQKMLNKIHKFDLNNERLMINDFERVVFGMYLEIERIKFDMYKLGASFALMSGSGSTVYGIFSAGNIKSAEKYFKRKKCKVFAV
ncbi:MAG: 4-(cytidine 5'-diphospho)-2-C-methyl-D-erythritol kinase [Ignavibacteria bacterium]